MKIKMMVCSALAAVLLAGCATENQAKLMAEAKVSKEAAEKSALAKVPNGTIKEAEIEKENGKLQWSFDVTTPDSKGITEVNVDAMTGNVISVETESAQSEAEEAGEGQTQAKEERVSLAQLSAPARATVEKVTTGGTIEQMTKEFERGKTVYDVEATVGGRHLEFLIADADGAVLGTEVPIEFSELPAAVRTAAEKFFGTATGLKVMKGVEYGGTAYEIEGLKNGKTVEVTFNPAGKPAN